MAKLMVLLIGIAVLFSVIAFKGGNPLVGLLFVVVAAAPVLYVGYAVATRRRAGGTSARGAGPSSAGSGPCSSGRPRWSRCWPSATASTG
ncbi:hypothetical protein O1L55_34975 [Streptomyces albulus]|nr:hypothetical protein [Streptomyces noursei]